MRNVNEVNIIRETIFRAYDNVNHIIKEIEKITNDHFTIIDYTNNVLFNESDVMIAIKYDDVNRDNAILIIKAKVIELNERNMLLITEII